MAAYRVPEPRLETLNEKIADLNKRAKRLELPLVVLKVVKHEIETLPTYKDKIVSAEWLEESRGRIDEDRIGTVDRVWVHVEIEGAPVLVSGGWQFWATLQRLGDDVIVAAPEGHTVPVEFRSAERADRCDHCETDRRRKDTYLLRSEAGEFWIVGRNCLQDFIGKNRDALALAAFFENWLVICLDLENEDYGGEGYGGSRPDWTKLDRVMPLAASDVLVRGYVSRKTSEQSAEERRFKEATSSAVSFTLCPPLNLSAEDRKKLIKITDAGRELGTKALVWAIETFAGRDPGELSDYEANIRAIVRAPEGVIQNRHVGYACSIVPCYQRAMSELRERQERQKSEYVGMAGEKLVRELTLVRISACETQYGISHLHIMKDVDGNLFKWFSSGEAIWVPEDPVKNAADLAAYDAAMKVYEKAIKGWRAECEVLTDPKHIAIDLDNGNWNDLFAAREKASIEWNAKYPNGVPSMPAAPVRPQFPVQEGHAWAEGETLTVKFTVKGHEEYKEVKQTSVIRVSRVVPKPPKAPRKARAAKTQVQVEESPSA